MGMILNERSKNFCRIEKHKQDLDGIGKFRKMLLEDNISRVERLVQEGLRVGMAEGREFYHCDVSKDAFMRLGRADFTSAVEKISKMKLKAVERIDVYLRIAECMYENKMLEETERVFERAIKEAKKINGYYINCNASPTKGRTLGQCYALEDTRVLVLFEIKEAMKKCGLDTMAVDAAHQSDHIEAQRLMERIRKKLDRDEFYQKHEFVYPWNQLLSVSDLEKLLKSRG